MAYKKQIPGLTEELAAKAPLASPSFTGNVKIGAPSGETATSRLHLPAGTATAGTAPLKFTGGVALTTPEAGAVEFHDNKLYVTNVATRRAIDRTSNVLVATTTVANTTTETTIFTAHIEANDLKAGNLLKIHCCGLISNASAAEEITVNMYLGSTLIDSFTPSTRLLSNDLWDANAEIIVRSDGSSGSVSESLSISVGTSDEHHHIETQAINTTIANDFTVKIVWDKALAGNTISVFQGYMEFKN